MLVSICEHLDDRLVITCLAVVSHPLLDTLRSDRFWHARGSHLIQTLARSLPADVAHVLNGCAYLPVPEQHATVPLYVFQHSIDFSMGQERYAVTINTSITKEREGEQRQFYSALPELAGFRYDAGPKPAAFALQVYRAGAIDSLGFGVRTLQKISRGDFVLAYWGEYLPSSSSPPGRAIRYSQNYEEEDDEDTPYTLFGDEGVQPAELPKEDPEEEMPEDACQEECPMCGMEPDEEDEDDKHAFKIEASATGNVARWINHSMMEDNLQARLVQHPQVPQDAYLVEFVAKHDIAAGEPLLWNYLYGEHQLDGTRARKSAPWRGAGAAYQPEMLRSSIDDAPTRAEWYVDEGSHASQVRAGWPGARESSDTILIQGCPPAASTDKDGDDENGDDWNESDPDEDLEHHHELFPNENLPLVDTQWTHDEHNDPPAAPGDEERCEYWAAYRRHQ